MEKEKKFLLVFSLIIIFIILFLIFIPKLSGENSKLINGYPKDYYKRPKPDYTMNLKEENNSIEIYSLNYKSKEFMDSPATIYGLLFLPKDKTNVPGIILLPGGGVSKEDFKKRSMDLAQEGYAVLVIDQRGIGETGGDYPSYEQDYEIFTSGKEPIQHLGVYDALVAFDVLRDINNIDKNNIGIIGESMGGRYSVIAAALEKDIKGVIVISSSGFHAKDDSKPYTAYLLSIDPDQYISKISPRPLMMLQGDNDSMINIKDAQQTFNLAKQPKRFFIAEGCGHGYCSKMEEEYRTDLSILSG
jgi:dienelactone hydrolase